ncbi:hypothetical protein H2O14_02110 [Rhizobium sp. G21]|nr:hypothetical protein [Rhizobium sp. G21]
MDFKKVFMVVLPFVIVFPVSIEPKFYGIRKFIIKNIAIGKTEFYRARLSETKTGTAQRRPRTLE